MLNNLEQIVHNNPDSIIIVDKEGIVKFVNPQAEKVFCKNSKDFVGKPFGYPIDTEKTSEIKIIISSCVVKTAEFKATQIQWDKKDVYLVSLRDVSEYQIMKKQLEKSSIKMRQIFEQTVNALVSAGEKRDPYTAGHQQKVAKLACRIAEKIGLSKEQTEGIVVAGLLHDIGKIYVPDSILNKIGGLSDADFDTIKTHPQFSYDIVKGIDFPWPIAEIIIQHHERLNGTGYPMSLKSENLLIESKILAVADVIEAMSSDRPYRASLGIEKALEHINESKGILYDAIIVNACCDLFLNEGFEFK